MIQTLLQRIAMISITLAVIGILVHDTKFDQAVKIALPMTAALSFGLGMAMLEMSDPHTHSERGSLNRAQSHGLPRVLPPNDRRRHINQRRTAHGSDIGIGGIIWPNPV